MTLWARHLSLSSTYCAIRNVSDGSYSTYCAGRFAVRDAEQFDLCANPARKCAACVRVIDAERVRRGLVELRDVRPLFDAEMVDDRFDDGGEA